MEIMLLSSRPLDISRQRKLSRSYCDIGGDIGGNIRVDSISYQKQYGEDLNLFSMQDITSGYGRRSMQNPI